MTAEQGAPQRLTYFLTQFPVIVSYLRLFLLPVRQNLDHDIALRSSLADPVVAGGLLILLLVAAVGCRLWVRGRRVDAGDERWKVLAAFGIGWFFITLAVESTLIPIRDVMFEHRLYLPSVGLVMATAAAGWGAAGRYLSESRRIPVFIAIFVLLGTVLGSTTFLRNRVWKDEVTLWRDIVEKSPRKARAHGSLGHALQRSGNAEEAARSYLYAVKLTPEDFIARNNLGTLYLNSGHPELALEQFEAALRASPAKAMINFNRGLALEKIGRLVEAEAAYDNAVRIDRENDRALNNLGILQYRNGNRQAAAESFRQALRINPTNKQASENLASIERAEKKDAK
jgi:Flp pilus assembly protein TadD